MNIFHKTEGPRQASCQWDGFFFQAQSSTYAYCSGDCKNASRRERARADRDQAAAQEAWRIGELNNKELAEALIRCQYMPQSMQMELVREHEAQAPTRLMKWIRFKYEIMVVYLQVIIDKRKESDGSHSTPTSSGK